MKEEELLRLVEKETLKGESKMAIYIPSLTPFVRVGE